MSSRNQYLGDVERETAKSLNQALQQAQQLVAQGESSAATIRSRMRTIIEREGQAQVDYISVCDPKRFEELEEIQGKAMIALAVHVGKARLIDNCLIERI
jgi:pantoate--beta-alanine ligase